jgi:hypothetical protein
MKGSGVLAALRLLAGGAVAPPVAGLIVVAAYDVSWHAGLFPRGAPPHSLDAAASLASGAGLVAVPMTVLAIVFVLLWRDRGIALTPGRVVVLGAVLGNLPFALIVVGIVVAHVAGDGPGGIPRYWPGVRGAIVDLALGSIAGSAAAGAFWIVAVAGTVRPADSWHVISDS